MQQSKPTALLLATIAALLVANLFVNLSPQEAQAQAQPPVPPPMVDDTPRVVGITSFKVNFGHVIYRIWSDGRVERNFTNPSCPNSPAGKWCGWNTVPE